MTHMIRQEYLHVEVNGTEAEALALQRSLPGLCRHWLTPAIERVLERSAPPAGHLCIERLEIDVGTVLLERLEYDLAEAVAQELEKALRCHAPPQGTMPDPVSGTISQKSKERSLFETLIHFLKTGSLPWSFRLPRGITLEQLLLDSWREREASVAAPGVPVHALLHALASSTVRTRLIRQFSPVFLETLLLLISLEAKKTIAPVLQALTESRLPAVQREPLVQQLWETLFAQLATGKATSPRQLVREAWGGFPETVRREAFLVTAVERQWPGLVGEASAATGNEAAGEQISAASPGIAASRKGSSPLGEHPETGDGIYIENAGMVLLHPFLPRFFETLKIASDDELMQPERALCLLHFLAAGQPVAPEYELMLPKILCNVPLLEPVASVVLTAGEQEEAVALLEAVIRHWEALRNTSPEALREAFLMRPGKISLRHGEWLLQVESRTCDILLDQLPWGMSAVKLPWMERMLWVEWR